MNPVIGAVSIYKQYVYPEGKHMSPIHFHLLYPGGEYKVFLCEGNKYEFLHVRGAKLSPKARRNAVKNLDFEYIIECWFYYNSTGYLK